MKRSTTSPWHVHETKKEKKIRQVTNGCLSFFFEINGCLSTVASFFTLNRENSLIRLDLRFRFHSYQFYFPWSLISGNWCLKVTYSTANRPIGEMMWWLKWTEQGWVSAHRTAYMPFWTIATPIFFFTFGSGLCIFINPLGIVYPWKRESFHHVHSRSLILIASIICLKFKDWNGKLLLPPFCFALNILGQMLLVAVLLHLWP